MIQRHEPLVDDIIGFMNGDSSTTQCINEQLMQNSMYCRHDCDTMVNNIFAYGPDGKLFFEHWISQAAGLMPPLLHIFFHLSKSGLAGIRLLLTKVSLGGEVQMVCWLDLFHRKVLADFIVMSVITCWGLAIFTHHFGRPVSGGCVDCRAPFPGVKKNFHRIPKSAG